MSNLNLAVLQGNLTDDPKIMGNGDKKVARFTVANNTGYGDYKETAFVDCVAFGKQVEVIAKHFVKGKQIIVRGQISQNKWEDAEGQKRSKLEIRLDNFNGFSFVGNAGDKEATEGGGGDDPVAAGDTAEATEGDDPDKLF